MGENKCNLPGEFTCNLTSLEAHVRFCEGLEVKILRSTHLFMERFWRTITYENIYPASYDTIKNARVGIDEYIDKYNNRRLHSALNYDMPMKVYRQYFQTAA